MTGRDGVRMIEVSSQLTKEEWIHFNERYRKYMSKGARKIVVIGLVVFSVLFLWSGIGLLKGLYFTFHMANFPWSYTFRSLAFQLYGSKMLLTFIFLVFFLYYLFRVYVLFSPGYIRKKLDKQFSSDDFQESRVQLTDQSVGTYSNTIDLRLNWERITKVFYTEELMVLFGTDPQCIIISKRLLSNEEIQQVEERIADCFSGTVITLAL